MTRLTLLAACLLLFSACGDGVPSGAEGGGKGHRTLFVATLMSHPALDRIIAGMKDELNAQGYVEGENIKITTRSANGEINLIPTLVKDAGMMHPDVVVTVTTPVSQGFRGKLDIPMVFSAVTDPVGAGVVKSMAQATPGISGVSDAWPYREQLMLIKELFPQAKRVGVLYNPGEAASQYGIKRIREHARDLGLQIVDMVATRSAEVYDVTRQMIDSVDVVYLSSDNTVIQALPAALKVCLASRKGLIAGDSGTVKKGALAAVSVGYDGVGRSTGRIVARFLRGDLLVPPEIAKGDQIHINLDTARRIGLEIPERLRSKATLISAAEGGTE